MNARIAVIGYGPWAKCYLATMAAAGCPATYCVTRQRMGSEDTQQTDDWQALIRDHRVDGVICAVPPSLQCKVAEMAIKASIPCLLEKPVCLSVETHQQLCTLADTYNTPVMVNYTYLSEPAFSQFCRYYHGAPITHINTQSGQWGPFRRTCDPIWDWAVHDIAMAMHITQCAQIQTGQLSINASYAINDDCQGLAFTLDYQLANGCHINSYHSNCQTTKTRRMQVINQDGTGHYDNLSHPKVSFVHDTRRRWLACLDQRLPLTIVFEQFTALLAGQSIPNHYKLGFSLQVTEGLSKLIALSATN